MPPKTETTKARQIGNYLFVASIIIFELLTFLSNTINWDGFLPFVQNTFGLNLNNSFLLFYFYTTHQTIDIIYPGQLKIITLLFIPTALYAGIILSAGRNLLEAFLLFLSYVIPLPKTEWGQAFDQITKQPIPFCVVRVQAQDLMSNLDVFIGETITDLFGRYRLNFIAEENKKYFLKAHAKGYNDFLHELNPRQSSTVLMYENIGMRPIGALGSYNRGLLSQINDNVKANAVIYLYIAAAISFLFGSVGVLRQLTLGTGAYFMLFLISVSWNTYIFFIRRYEEEKGQLLFMENGTPAAGIGLDLYRGGKRITSSVANARGIVSFSAEPGAYEVKLMNSNETPMFRNHNAYQPAMQVEVSETGLINETLYLPLSSKDEANKRGSLPNPFA